MKVFVSIRLQLIGAGAAGKRSDLQIQGAGITDVLDTLASGKIGDEQTSVIEREAALVVASMK